MKALSVCQPWAWAIVAGVKAVENRVWRTSHRGPLLIHAGASRASMRAVLPDGTRVPDDLPFGCIVGTVEVVDCVPLDQCPPGPFREGPWCWLLARPRALPTPIPYRGAQRLFDVSEELVRDPAGYLLACLN
jgi:hypothetical protein